MNDANIKKKIILKKEIIQKAETLGFCLTGFAAADPMPEESNKFKEWIKSGNQADMVYLEKYIEKREDISSLLPGARTVIVCAMSYNTGIKHPKNAGESGLGKISSYAWGEDYHDVIKPKLRELISTISELDPESESRVFVDTGPVLEKSWAERAGLGVKGKNSLLLNKEYGSSVFLGIVITTSLIEPDKESASMCGTCNACIDACPTEALNSEGTLDARRCIAYWTIETRPPTEIPKDIAENMNDYIFGCDICRNVCPYNDKAKITDCSEFLPRKGETCLDLSTVMSMTQEEFSDRFRKSPVKRLKLAGLKRNAEIIKKFPG